MSARRVENAKVVRAHLAAHDPALLKILDQMRAAYGARLTSYWCPLITVNYVDALGRRVRAYWRGTAFHSFVITRARVC